MVTNTIKAIMTRIDCLCCVFTFVQKNWNQLSLMALNHHHIVGHKHYHFVIQIISIAKMAVLQYCVLSGQLCGDSACLIISRESNLQQKWPWMTFPTLTVIQWPLFSRTHPWPLLVCLILTVCTISVLNKLSGMSPQVLLDF